MISSFVTVSELLLTSEYDAYIPAQHNWGVSQMNSCRYILWTHLVRSSIPTVAET